MAKGNRILSLPLLVTRGLVVFPNTVQLIDASRDFSIRAVDESRLTYDSMMIIVSQIDSAIDKPTPNDIYKIGTLTRIINFVDKSDKTGPVYRIRVSATSKVKINNIHVENGTYVCQFEIVEDVLGDSKEEAALIKNILNELRKQANQNALPKNVISAISSKDFSSFDLANTLGTYLPMSIKKKQSVLEESNINEKLTSLLQVMIEETQIAEIDNKIQEKVRMSAEKSQKEYFLREKMKAIKEELGEDGENSEESILDQLDKNPYPDYVKTKIKSEFKRFNMMPQASLEASLIKSYIDLVMAVPWYQQTEDNDDITNVKKILDEDHFGLEKVKKRIVEYLAVKKMTGNLKAPILCFYGPPGVGKTSLGKSIARALGRKFVKSSLGGISDEAEIRGHRRTYVGSMPGRIIAGMKKAGVNNPVFLLDEVDKLASSMKGDPASALLEVLDPEQNYAFNDNYLEEPYDLSNVLFIATANYLENIPGPLRDRLELIEVNSYTELEKIEIAKKFLVKKQLAENGVNSKQITFSKDSIKYIINHYTRESGVRELERCIASVIRKGIVDILTNSNKKTVKVDIETIKKYLGVEIFENTKKENTNQIGVVTGLAYTQYGGDILPIEVNYFPGKGGLILTGNLGDVMKESASIALDYVKANASRYSIDPKLFSENDIHIHVPEGAVPKDGPSAGVAMTTAIISCLSKTAVKNDVAMTGEVSLRGNALPIGGLREKSLAALRSGIKTIIVPEENKKDVNELPQEVKDTLNIVFMTKVDDALEVAFVK